MNIKLILIGKTDEKYLQHGIGIFEKRLKHYIPFEIIIIPSLKDIKNLNSNIINIKEGELILKQIDKTDKVFLFDEKGSNYRSKEFANFLQKNMNNGVKNLVFIIGGAYGFSQEVYSKIPDKISISNMTFSHQMIRLMVVEQIYRGFSILKNEPYHNE